MASILRSAVIWILIFLFAPVRVSATAAGGENGKSGNQVLSERTLLRVFNVEKTPVVIDRDGKFQAAFVPRKMRGKLIKTPIGKYQSPLPEDGWQKTDFDDSEWSQGRVPLEKRRHAASGRGLSALHSATNSAVICARGKFLVDDPAAAGDLKLSVTYVGGLAVFINGKEVARRHLPKGELTADTLADKYPDDLYITADGKYLQDDKETQTEKARFGRRYRKLTDLTIPAAALRRGLNVLALQAHRAPVNAATTTIERRVYGGMYRVYGIWPYVALTGLSLRAAGTGGFAANTGARPQGVQVWNCQSFATLNLNSFGDPGAEPAPVVIDAVRNGVFSGRFVVSSDGAIRGLTVKVSELATADGKSTLPAGSVQLRHGRRALDAETPRPTHMFDALLPGVPQDVEICSLKVGRRDPVTYAGAVLPVWITVRPPKDAAPGLYEGRVTVTAEALATTVLPLRVRVHDWTLPDPIDYRVRHLNTLAPYWVAKHYKVPLWGEKHFELMERSFSLMAEINARRADIDLAPGVRYWAGGCPPDNTMFQLVARKDGKGYDYDFTVVERMLDLIGKTMKEPLPLIVNCWGDNRIKGKAEPGWANVSKQVQVLDPASGKLSYLPNPPPGTEENYRFWKPILDELRGKIEKRGWFKQTAIGHQSYCWPAHPKQVAIARRIWPDVVYSFTAHSGTLGSSWKATGGAKAPVRYSECVWTQGRLEPRGYRKLLKPGRDVNIWNSCSRDQHRDDSPLSLLLRKPEEMIMRGHDGLGYLCADFLRIENPKRKGRYEHFEANSGGVMGRSTTSILAAGPDGPIETGRYEMFREGTQQSETIIFLQRALDSKKLDAGLAKRVDDYLEERGRMFVKGWHANRRGRDRKLFELAAEVAGAAAEKG